MKKVKFILLTLILTICCQTNFNSLDIYALNDNEYFIEEGIESYFGYGCNNDFNNVEDCPNANMEFTFGDGCGDDCLGSREFGYSSSYNDECKQWQIMPFYTPQYKYYIDYNTLTSLTDAEKITFISNVDSSADEWNSIRIADSNEEIVNIVKVSEHNSDGVPIRYNPDLDGVIGYYNPIPGFYYVEIKNITDRQTMLHEFGHMIGLQDLDRQNEQEDWCHISLMGYANDDLLHYQDIQGASIANNLHTNHSFYRYWLDNDVYKFACFYCDITDSRLTNYYNGEHLEYASSCVHSFCKLASAGSRIWQKCEKCYKVIENEFNFEINDDSTVEIKGIYDMRNVISIPSQICGLTVTSIGAGAFKNHSHLSNVSLPNTIKHINPNAFENCTNLSTITLPNNLESIGESAFKNCEGLRSITLPSNLLNISSYAFENCTNLVRIIVNREVSEITTIGTSVFVGCDSLTKIIIPQNRIGDYLNNTNWSLYSSIIIPSSSIYTTLNINENTDITRTVNLLEKMNTIYKIVISSSTTYNFITSSDFEIYVKLYDENYSLITYSFGHNQENVTRYVSEGTYYYSVEFYNPNDSGTISTRIKKDDTHLHNYGNCQWVNYTSHTGECNCGHTTSLPHVVSDDSYTSGQKFATCLICGGSAEIGFVEIMSINTQINMFSLNGSFVLPNGVIVLDPKDLELYLKGELSFKAMNSFSM